MFSSFQVALVFCEKKAQASTLHDGHDDEISN